MSVITVTSRVKEEYAADAQAALDKFFQAIEQAQPAGVRYAVTKLGDGVTFVAFLEVENSEDPVNDNPLRELPEHAEFLANLRQWAAEPGTIDRMTVVGSYRLF